MTEAAPQVRRLRCAIYTRRSTEEGLEQAFNTLQAQREAAEAYIQSQKEGGWVALPEQYDDEGSVERAWSVRRCSVYWMQLTRAVSTA